MKRNTHGGTVYTNQGDTAQAKSHASASRAIVERAVENPPALGTGEAQPTRICAQDASASVERNPDRRRAGFGFLAVLAIIWWIGRTQGPTDGQAAKLSADPRRIRFTALATSCTLLASLRLRRASDVKMPAATHRCTTDQTAEVDEVDLGATLAIPTTSMNARANRSQVIGTSVTGVSGVCGHSISAADNEDAEILRLCEGIGYIPATMVLEA